MLTQQEKVTDYSNFSVVTKQDYSVIHRRDINALKVTY